jgi:Fe2+ or Zn2+ uptake regulation protein
MTYRNSRQRQAILAAFERHGGHLTADQVHALVRAEFPRLSLGTVYRNLRVLIAQGAVRELRAGTALSYFELAAESHYHLICRVCGHIADVEVPFDDQLARLIHQSGKVSGFQIEDHRLDFIGVCPSCQKRARRSGRRKAPASH